MLLFILPRKMRQNIARKRPLALLINFGSWLLVAAAAFTVGIKITESIPWGEAVWQVWQTITTVGYGNAPAKTGLGREVTMFFGLLCIAMLGSCITSAMDLKAENQAKRRLGKLKNPHADGYVVFNMPPVDDFVSLVEELRVAEPNVPICIVDGELTELPVEIDILGHIHFVRGSLTDKATYDQAVVSGQKAVIVFPVKPGNPASDLTTKGICELLEGYVGEKTRMMHVLVSDKNSWMFKNTKSQGIGEDMELLAIVQECKDPHTAEAIHILLSNSRGANPATVETSRLAGASWASLRTGFIECGSTIGVTVGLFALIHDGSVDLCPQPQTRLVPGDQLIIIADNGFQWSPFEKEVAKKAGLS